MYRWHAEFMFNALRSLPPHLPGDGLRLVQHIHRPRRVWHFADCGRVGRNRHAFKEVVERSNSTAKRQIPNRAETEMGSGDDMKIVVGWSCGVTSARAGGWALDNFPKEDVVFLFHDTKEEDSDTYRFGREMSLALHCGFSEPLPAL